MKKSCNGCRAYDGDRCELGFETKVKQYFNYIPVELMPTEECPKPTTNHKFIDLSELKRSGFNKVELISHSKS
jgi:hypothetical protein